MREKVSVVIPCYRSENTLRMVVDEVRTTCQLHPEYDLEIVLVSDASPDHVYDVICELARDDARIKGIEMARNFGQHSALMAGYRATTGDIIISLDDDGQIPSDRMFELVEKIQEGYDVVYANYTNSTRGAFRGMGTKINDIMADKLIDKPRNLQITSFFAMKRFIKDEIIRYDAAFPYIAGLVLRATKKICNIPVTLRERASGKSGYTFKKLLSLWMNGFTAFSIKPLRVSTIAGVVCAAFGFALGLYTVIHKILDPSVAAGYSSTMAVLLFVGGMIMLMLGMIGEYIGRIYISINNSPQYVIRRSINCESDMDS